MPSASHLFPPARQVRTHHIASIQAAGGAIDCLAPHAGKLPGELVRITYGLEYSTATLEMQTVPHLKGKRAVVVDDVLATGGTLAAAIKLSQDTGLHVAFAVVLAELEFLGGTAKVPLPVHTFVRM